MSFVFQPDHYEQARLLLIQLFQDKPKFLALLKTFTTEAQEIEQSLADLDTAFDPATAEGSQLDVLGEIIGEARAGKTDADYRIFLLARLLINRSSGTVPQILELFSLVGGAGTVAEISQYYPASFVLYLVPGPDYAFSAESYRKLLNEVTPAGVRSDLIYAEDPTEGGEDLFTLSSLPSTVEISSTQGLANLAQTTGGKLAGVL